MAEIDAIEEDESDAEQFPSACPSELDIDLWLINRIAGSAHLAGRLTSHQQKSRRPSPTL